MCYFKERLNKGLYMTNPINLFDQKTLKTYKVLSRLFSFDIDRLVF